MLCLKGIKTPERETKTKGHFTANNTEFELDK